MIGPRVSNKSVAEALDAGYQVFAAVAGAAVAGFAALGYSALTGHDMSQFVSVAMAAGAGSYGTSLLRSIIGDKVEVTEEEADANTVATEVVDGDAPNENDQAATDEEPAPADNDAAANDNEPAPDEVETTEEETDTGPAEEAGAANDNESAADDTGPANDNGPAADGPPADDPAPDTST